MAETFLNEIAQHESIHYQKLPFTNSMFVVFFLDVDLLLHRLQRLHRSFFIWSTSENEKPLTANANNYNDKNHILVKHQDEVSFIQFTIKLFSIPMEHTFFSSSFSSLKCLWYLVLFFFSSFTFILWNISRYHYKLGSCEWSIILNGWWMRWKKKLLET